MKLSLKLQDDPQHDNQQNQILTAKVPVTIINQPFVSGITTTTTKSASELSFSLSTNFQSGPNLKLSYSPTSSTASPFSLSLKSGLGLFGSPHNSPLVFSAHFSLSPTNTPVPAFFLQFKPQFGHFSLNKTTSSNPNPYQISGSLINSRTHSDSGLQHNSELGNGFVPEGSSVWQELKLEPLSGKDEFDDLKKPNGNCEVHSNGGIESVTERPLVWENKRKNGFLSGVAVMARTVMPVTKGVMLNFRWGVKLPADLGSKMPYLTVNKIGIERVGEEKEVKQKKQVMDSSAGDLDLLKGMYSWLRRDLEVLEKENRELKQTLDGIKLGVSTRNYHRDSNGVSKSFMQNSDESSNEFERWRNKKSGREDNEQIESKKSTSNVSDLESELQRAIKAASS
ncbi:Hsp90 co-chaperone Cdc37, N-terminally processed like [Quillaja saponaria]|uniref:Hsp90 co-chaperone Cdc37, N-terminally processed like n=2 Tax=Quillaja saponaria TaxID=32244 RepID=A0AAD7PF66_QUISA|nr:Hsp90 co-chaperone Cdc37, N-terminally processed like [Quillaja saponaria]